MSCQAALYVDGRVVTGLNHGDAYSKLNEEEKHHDICSGFLDEEHHQFITDDDRVYYMKKIILIRHADAQSHNEDNPGITDLGHSQVHGVASFFRELNIKNLTWLSSPLRRCQVTSFSFCNELNIHFEIDENLTDGDNEPIGMFKSRIKKVLDYVPDNVVLITHCSFIRNAVEIVEKETNNFNSVVANCSVTLLENSVLVYMGRIVY